MDLRLEEYPIVDLYRFYGQGLYQDQFRDSMVLARIAAANGLPVQKSFPALLAVYDSLNLDLCPKRSNINNCVARAASAGNLELVIKFIENGADNYSAILFGAAQSDNTEILSLAYQALSHDPKLQMVSAREAMEEATYLSSDKVVKWLYENIPGIGHLPEMIGAIRSEDLGLVKKIYRENPSEIDPYFDEILEYSARFDIGVTKYLLKKSEERYPIPEMVYNFDYPPLIRGASEANNKDLIDFLLESYEGTGNLDQNILYGAVNSGNIDLLIQYYNPKAKTSVSLPGMAAGKGHLHILKWLSEKEQLDPDQLLSWTLIGPADDQDKLKVIEYLKGYGVVQDITNNLTGLSKIVLDSLPMKDNLNYYPVLLASSMNNNTDLAEWAIEHGVKDFDQASDIAAGRGNLEVLELMDRITKLDYNQIMVSAARGSSLRAIKWADSRGANNYTQAMTELVNRGGGQTQAYKYLEMRTRLSGG